MRRARTLLGIVAVMAGTIALPGVEGAVAQETLTGPSTDQYTPVTPVRLLDTRTSNGGHPGKLGATEVFNLQITGRFGIPAGVTAVQVNVTVTEPTAASFLTVYPAGTARPTASNLNFVAGQTVPNQVLVRLDGLGRAAIYNHAGGTHVIVDIAGHYRPGIGVRFEPVAPIRLWDSRVNGQPLGPAGSFVEFSFSLPPLSEATALALNVTVTGSSTSGFLTVYPGGGSIPPTASNLNFTAGQTIANAVVATLGPGKTMRLTTNAAFAHYVIDWVGSFGGKSNGRLNSQVPQRVIDTRDTGTPIGPAQTLELDLTGVAGIPEAQPGVVILNLTAVAPTASGYLTVHPWFTPRPVASALNFTPGRTVPNLVFATVDPSGRVKIFNSAGATHIVVDVVAWFDRPSVQYKIEGFFQNPGSETEDMADVVINDAGVHAYVSNPLFDRMETLDVTTGLFRGSIPVGGDPAGLDTGIDGNVYVTSRDLHKLSVVDPVTQRQIDAIDLPDTTSIPVSIVVLSNNHAFVCAVSAVAGGPAKLFDIDLTTGDGVDRTAELLESQPTHHCWVERSGDRDTALVFRRSATASYSNAHVYDVALDEFEANANIQSRVTHGAVSADGSQFVLGGDRAFGVYNRDLVRLRTLTVPAGITALAGVAFSPDSTRILALGSDSLWYFSTATGSSTDRVYLFDSFAFDVVSPGHHIAFSPDGVQMVATGEQSIVLARP